MREYHKIDSVYKRDPATHHKTFIDGDYSNPAFEYLANNKWLFTEKVDGTNIRIMITEQKGTVHFGGKTDNASMPAPLVSKLQDIFLPKVAQLNEMFSGWACLYGEGYGAKIQKGGGNYRPDQSFVLFDVWVPSDDGRGWWLERKNVEDIAKTLGIDIVPIIGIGHLSDMIDKTKRGFESLWGKFTAEGIVARPMTELCDRAGKRIITKVKHKDFQRP